MRLKITTHFHRKNIAKMIGIVIPVFIVLLLFFEYLEIPPVTAIILSVFIGGVIAEYCSKCWELWHFEHKHINKKD